VCDIASDGLVYALDPNVLGYERDEKKFFKDSEVLLALKNILQAQQFDAIPLIQKYKGEVTHLARRRLHDGDEHELHILSKSEVECVSRDSSILECMFRILANQHHILLLEDSEGEVTDILTISMLNSEKVKSYLRLKTSQLSEDEWNWNRDYLSNSKKVDIDYATEIFSQIKELAELLSEDYIEEHNSVPKDIDVSKKIVKLLSDLQPLKPFAENVDSLSLENERFYLEASVEKKPEHTAKEIQHEWGGSLIDLEEEYHHVVDLAFKLFSGANDWDEILLRKENQEWSKLSQSQDGSIVESEVIKINENDSYLTIANLLNDNECKMLVVENENSKWPGIITIHDFALNKKVQNYLLSNLTQIEVNCREALVEEGIQFIIDRNKMRKLISVANLNDVIELLNDRNLLKKNSKQHKKLDIIRFCRNKLVHEIIGDDLEVLPSYLWFIFLEGVIYGEELKELFEISSHNQAVYSYIVALDAFVFGSEYLIHRKTSKELRKLVQNFIDLEFDEGIITIKIKNNSDKLNNELDREIDIGTWRGLLLSYFEGIDEIKIIDA
tara:strand:+ start:5797 stop:7464 length:1668 start_codon:yes stop_codon:yes gene_type:complete